MKNESNHPKENRERECFSEADEVREAMIFASLGQPVNQSDPDEEKPGEDRSR